jgi:membrane protease YdiL (CAAX protease family)
MERRLKSSKLTVTSRRGWWIHLILVSAYVLYIGVSGLLLHDKQHVAVQTNPLTGLLFGYGIELAFFGVVFGLAFYASQATPDDLLLRWRGNVKPLLFGASYAIGLRLIVTILLKLLFVVLILSGALQSYQFLDIAAAQHSGAERIVSSAALRYSPAYFWLSLVFTSFIMAGLCEELWRSAVIAAFKILWPDNFKSNMGQVGAVAIAAVMFGFGHTTQSPLAVLQAGLMGFGFGLIMVFHHSIWPAVIAHGFFDATTMIMVQLNLLH